MFAAVEQKTSSTDISVAVIGTSSAWSASMAS
jgi:hypothetical protein